MAVAIVVFTLGSSAMAQGRGNLPTCPPNGSKKSCFGESYSANGQKYIGVFRNGMRNGQGTLIFSNGDRYSGDFKDDLLDGFGTYNYADGSRYVGEYRQGRLNGKGTYTTVDGEKFVGQYVDDMRNGQGTLYNANGSIAKSGYWQNNDLAGLKSRG